MPSNPAFSVHDGATGSGEASRPSLQARDDELRAELVRLMKAPVRDFLLIDQLVDQLEQLQLALKGEHGIQGNNPNE
jgi:hypothetical protein